MTRNDFEITICLILLSTVGTLIIINKSISVSESLKNVKSEYSWVVHVLQNILGYSTVFLPGYLVYRFVHKTNYLDKPRDNCISVVISKCFEGKYFDYSNPNLKQQEARTLLQDAFLLALYFAGLQISFLTWGVLQEKVMTQKYVDTGGNIGRFTDSQFLVLVNRILAFCMSGTIILCTRQPPHKAPLFKYVFCSFSNILSSWCQYEALKYVSFPHQVLAKAAKVIPVMIGGKIISRIKYEYYEYVTAVVLSIGMLLFMLDTENDHKTSTATTVSGVILLCCYLVFDSFTSNWQGALFKQYEMKPIQMMCGINLFSCIFTAVSLIQQGGLVTSVHFMLQFPQFIGDCVLLSVCSAGGQLLIFKTIATFGPLVFAIITTIRQGLSVLLSCVIYQHHIAPLGLSGIILVFLSISLRIYCGYRVKILRKYRQNELIK